MRPLVYLLVQYAQITLKAFFWRFDARKRYSISVVSQTHYNSLQAYYKLITSNATVILLCNETYYNTITKPKERGREGGREGGREREGEREKDGGLIKQS